jgi:hypothetical protein
MYGVEPQIREPVRTQKRALMLTWAGSAAALIIYLTVPWFLSLQGIAPEGESYEGLRAILWFVAFIQVAVLLFWTRRVLSEEVVRRAVRGTAIDPLKYYTGKKIAAIGMAQSIAAYGLVLALIGPYFWDQYILTMIAATLLIRHYPSRRSLDKIKSALEATNQPR